MFCPLCICVCVFASCIVYCLRPRWGMCAAPSLTGPENPGLSYKESCSPSTNALQNVIIVTVITTDIRAYNYNKGCHHYHNKVFLAKFVGRRNLTLGKTDQTAGYDGMGVKTLGCCITAIFPCNHYCNVLQWLIIVIRLICCVFNSATSHWTPHRCISYCFAALLFFKIHRTQNTLNSSTVYFMCFTFCFASLLDLVDFSSSLWKSLLPPGSLLSPNDLRPRT